MATQTRIPPWTGQQIIIARGPSHIGRGKPTQIYSDVEKPSFRTLLASFHHKPLFDDPFLISVGLTSDVIYAYAYYLSKNFTNVCTIRFSIHVNGPETKIDWENDEKQLMTQSIENCLEGKRRFVFIPMNIDTGVTPHANFVIIDTIKKHIEIWEPSSQVPAYDPNIVFDYLHSILGKNYTTEATEKTCDINGLQHLHLMTINDKKLSKRAKNMFGDIGLGGYCALWSLLYLHLRLLFPNQSKRNLMRYMEKLANKTSTLKILTLWANLIQGQVLPENLKTILRSKWSIGHMQNYLDISPDTLDQLNIILTDIVKPSVSEWESLMILHAQALQTLFKAPEVPRYFRRKLTPKKNIPITTEQIERFRTDIRKRQVIPLIARRELFLPSEYN